MAALARQAGFDETGEPGRVISGLELPEMDEAQFRQAALDTAILSHLRPLPTRIQNISGYHCSRCFETPVGVKTRLRTGDRLEFSWYPEHK